MKDVGLFYMYDVRGRAGETNFMKINEKESRRTLQDRDDDNENKLFAIVNAIHKFKI